MGSLFLCISARSALPPALPPTNASLPLRAFAPPRAFSIAGKVSSWQVYVGLTLLLLEKYLLSPSVLSQLLWPCSAHRPAPEPSLCPEEQSGWSAWLSQVMCPRGRGSSQTKVTKAPRSSRWLPHLEAPASCSHVFIGLESLRVGVIEPQVCYRKMRFSCRRGKEARDLPDGSRTKASKQWAKRTLPQHWVWAGQGQGSRAGEPEA